MKTSVALAVVAAVVAVASCGAIAPQSVDWSRVSSKTDQVEAAVTGGINLIVEEAKKDNAKVGESIETKFSLPLIMAKVVVDQARVAIRAQTLNRLQAQGHFANIRVLFTTALTEIDADVAKLSSATREKIASYTDQVETITERLANEIYVLLDAGNGTPGGIDWNAVDGKSEVLRSVIKDTISGAGNISYLDSPIIGSIIQIQLANHEGKVHVQIGRMKGAIREQSLTFAEAEYFLGQIQLIIPRAQEEVREDVALLSPAAQALFNQILTNGQMQLVNASGEVLALLEPAGGFILAADWVAANARAEELRGVINGAVNTIRAAALADNPIVGSDIARQLNIANGQVNGILGRIKNGISRQTLTVDQARAHLQEMNAIQNELAQNLADSVNQLSAEAQATIRDARDAAAVDAKNAADQLLSALEGAAVRTLVADWVAANARAEELRGVINGAVNTIRAAALADNPIVGSDIARQLNIANGQVNGILGRIKNGISRQTLTVDQARAHLQEMNAIQNELVQNLADSVNQLSAEAQATIRDARAAAAVDANNAANQLLSALDGSAVGTLVADWDLAEAKVEELRSVINTAVASIRATAIAANPILGEQISAALNAASSQANAIVGKTHGAITRKTLTVDQARANLAELKSVNDAAVQTIEPLVSQLPQNPQGSIRTTYGNAVVAARERANELVNSLA